MTKKAEELQKETEDFLNVMCNEEAQNKFVDLMSRSHQTLQQNYTRFVMKWIVKKASNQYYDARSKASVELCQKIMKVLDNDYYLPTI